MQVAKKSGIGMDGGIASVNSDTPDAVKLVGPSETVRQLVACNPVVVFSMSGCCMCTVAKRLLFILGVGPVIIELDKHSAGPDVQAVLQELCSDGQKPVPAVFVGGKFLGGVETLVTCHIKGSLVPLLKDAGGLWL
ncbi:glutaredoxin-C9-like [Corylus avellana]|uniref:glutaredoxin-C9-like n=1 Tax=Corylus avellana TaxID=13451 RepID=UPI00286CD3CE|nr:glutaredoxin-C9-like [Corylus avellana]